MLKKRFFIFLIFFVLLIESIPVFAHCPLCTAAVGAAAVSAKYYGMDISIIGLLIGAFGISTGLWIGLKAKRYFKFQLPAIVAASFLLTVIPLMYIGNDSIYLPVLLFGQAGSLLNKVYWINKFLMGNIIGALATIFAYFIHISIKKQKGSVLFPYQGIAFTVAFLAISGIGLYFAFV